MERTQSSGSQSTRSVQVGVVLFVAGVVFIAIDVLPFFFGTTDRPLWLNLACLAAPIGFVLAVVGAWRQGRAVARAAVRLTRLSSAREEHHDGR